MRYFCLKSTIEPKRGRERVAMHFHTLTRRARGETRPRETRVPTATPYGNLAQSSWQHANTNKWPRTSRRVTSRRETRPRIADARDDVGVYCASVDTSSLAERAGPPPPPRSHSFAAIDESLYPRCRSTHLLISASERMRSRRDIKKLREERKWQERKRPEERKGEKMRMNG